MNELENKEELTLRPKKLNEYIGQNKFKNNLEIFIKAAKNRNEVLDHLLLYGPPGLGKTTLAHIISNEMNNKIRVINGPSIERVGDLASLLSTIEEGEIIFIDEIHRLPKVVEEMLYSAMEDFKLITIISEKDSSSSINIDLPPFTLIGATTKMGLLSSPLRERFGIICKFEYYSNSDMDKIVKRTSKVFSFKIDEEASNLIASRSRGTPRIANRLFKRIRDFASIKNKKIIDYNLAVEALNLMNVDENGLDEIDIKYLRTLILRFNGGPAGVDAIASSMNEDISNLEEVCEPFLLLEGYINRTPRGRVALEKSYKHLKIKKS